MKDVNKEVQNYYGKELSKSEDLKTNACCTLNAPPTHIQNALKNVHDEVQAKYYGCGLTIPDNLEGLRILDLGSGSGRDCYIASQLVGKNGEVIGVDMTDEQLEVANNFKDHHAKLFGFSNVSFLKGNIEKLDELGLGPDSFDLIISNCVINLAQNKEKVLKDAYSLLKEGGEIYFSDVYSTRRIPEHLKNDQVLWGECLSGALYWNDFYTLANKAGFTPPRDIEYKDISISNEELEKKTGDIRFCSVTYRLFKIENLEAGDENYGQAVKYKGSISESSNGFTLDLNHFYETGKVESVSSNTYSILKKSRYSEHFEFYGDTSTHFGIFEQDGIKAPFGNKTIEKTKDSGSCC